MTPQTKEIDHTYTNEIVCPWCGYALISSWEIAMDTDDGDLGILECPACEKEYDATRNILISYSTKKVGESE